MRLSRDYFFTLREDAKEEDSLSGNLLVRAGMIKKSTSGVYMMLPLGLRCLRKVENIIREEMNAINSYELKMPSLIPEEVYVDSGRREAFGKSMFSLRDRFDKPFVLGPTHEELFSIVARMAIKSYKDLPASLYQIQTKFRDEPRPRYGLIRVREFTMKDAYTFDRTPEDLDVSYNYMFEAYKRIFDRMCLYYKIITSDTGVMGGMLSEEFQALTDIGEDYLVVQEDSDYAENREIAKCLIDGEMSDEEIKEPYYMDTPGARTIEQVAEFFDCAATDFVKTLIFNIDGKLYALLVRGDHDVNITKVAKLLGAYSIELATPEEVFAATNAPVGFAGPVGLNIPIIMDQQISVMKNFIVGGNEVDKHMMNCNLNMFQPYKVADIRYIVEGDMCENGKGPVHFQRGIEVGNTFKLGTKYSQAMDLSFLDEHNQQHPCWMGCYGIGVERCMAAIVEQNHDDKGIIWPKHLAPVQVAIVVINSKDEEQMAAANKLYETIRQETDIDVLIDDRHERAGVKFNDMDLIGAYARITVGRDLKDGKVELKLRTSDEKKLIDVDKVLETCTELFSTEERREYGHTLNLERYM